MTEEGRGSMHGCWSGRGSSSSRSTLESASSKVTADVMVLASMLRDQSGLDRKYVWLLKLHSNKTISQLENPTNTHCDIKCVSVWWSHMGSVSQSQTAADCWLFKWHRHWLNNQKIHCNQNWQWVKKNLLWKPASQKARRAQRSRSGEFTRLLLWRVEKQSSDANNKPLSSD